jgi:hypothetical protein
MAAGDGVGYYTCVSSESLSFIVIVGLAIRGVGIAMTMVMVSPWQGSSQSLSI